MPENGENEGDKEPGSPSKRKQSISPRKSIAKGADDSPDKRKQSMKPKKSIVPEADEPKGGENEAKQTEAEAEGKPPIATKKASMRKKSIAKGKAAKEEDAPVTGRKMSRKASRKQSKAQTEQEQEAEAEKEAAPAETEEKDEGSRKQSLANGADDGKKRKGSKFSIGGKKK